MLYNPSLNGSGNRDTGGNQGDGLVASDGGVSSALVSSSGFTKRSSGYGGPFSGSDGLLDLFDNQQLDNQFDSASTPGNLVQIGQIPMGNDTTFVLALGFGENPSQALSNATNSLSTPFASHVSAYQNG